MLHLLLKVQQPLRWLIKFHPKSTLIYDHKSEVWVLPHLFFKKLDPSLSPYYFHLAPPITSTATTSSHTSAFLLIPSVLVRHWIIQRCAFVWQTDVAVKPLKIIRFCLITPDPAWEHKLSAKNAMLTPWPPKTSQWVQMTHGCVKKKSAVDLNKQRTRIYWHRGCCFITAINSRTQIVSSAPLSVPGKADKSDWLEHAIKEPAVKPNFLIKQVSFQRLLQSMLFAPFNKTKLAINSR